LAEQCGRVKIPSPLDDLLRRRIARAINRCARHERSAVAVSAIRIRALLGGARPIGVDRALEKLLHRNESHDADWMVEAERLLSTCVRARPVGGRARVAALLVLGAARAVATVPPSPSPAPAS
jgi:hypothetical protein